MTDRRAAMQFLENAVKKAFSQGIQATIGGSDYLFLKRGEEVEVGDHIMVTTESGIFQRSPVYERDQSSQVKQVVRHTLLHYGHAEQLSGILEHLCKDMSAHEIDMTMVNITSHTALSNKSITRDIGSGGEFTARNTA